jgi:hypothetical protein
MRLLELADDQCRWPVPLEGPSSGAFCGKATPRHGLPYCEAHMAQAYVRAHRFKMRPRPSWYAGAGALPHHDIAA